MPKNILVMTGSPRKDGNSNLLAEAFLRGAREAGHDVRHFNCFKEPIKTCVHCDTCWSKGKPCSFSDSFEKLAPMLEEADVLVLCTPLWVFTFSTYIKAALDKLYAYSMPKSPKKLRGKEAFLLACAENPDPSAFTGLAGSYDSLCKALRWTDRGKLLVSHVQGKGDIATTGAVAQAERMGREA